MPVFNELLLDLYGGAQNLGVHEFSEHSIKAVKQALQFDSATLIDYAVSGQSQIGMQTIHLHHIPIEKLQERVLYAGEETMTAQGMLVSQDTILQAAIANRGQIVTADISQAFRNHPMQAYCRKFEAAHSLVIATKTKEGVFSLAAFWRADCKKSYGAADVAMAQNLLPHLLLAKQINQQLAVAGAVVNVNRGNQPRATILSTFDGRLYVVGSTAIALLQREWKQWHPPVLPARLMNALASSACLRFVGSAITINASIQSGLLCMELAATCAADSLTPAENRVARLAATGLQYKEIAKSVNASPATVRNQLQAVYRKLGVSNKTALAAAMSYL